MHTPNLSNQLKKWVISQLFVKHFDQFSANSKFCRSEIISLLIKIRVILICMPSLGVSETRSRGRTAGSFFDISLFFFKISFFLSPFFKNLNADFSQLASAVRHCCIYAYRHFDKGCPTQAYKRTQHRGVAWSFRLGTHRKEGREPLGGSGNFFFFQGLGNVISHVFQVEVS